MHAHFCRMTNTCMGVPAVDDIPDVAFTAVDTDCIYSNESRWGLTGIKFGFRPFASNPRPRTPANYPPSKISEHIGPDVQHEYKEGWLRMLVRSWFTSPMFVKDESSADDDKYRVIKNFSDKDDSTDEPSLNDFCTYNRIAYMTIRCALAFMIPFCFFAMVDISQAFRTLPVHPSQSVFLVYSWFGRLFQDLRLPWGLRPSSEFFCRISALVRLMLLAKGFKGILVYCDDFFCIGNTLEETMLMFDTLKKLLLALGFTWKKKKCLGPAQRRKWLGFWFESNFDGQGGMRITMDPDKLVRLQKMFRTVLHTGQVSKKQLARIIGLCVHLAQTVFGAKGFYRHLTFLLHSLRTNDTLTPAQLSAFMHDARFWLTSVSNHDGTAIIVDRPAISAQYVATDACVDKSGFVGIGWFMDGRYVSICGKSFALFLSVLRAAANPLQWQHRANWPCNPKYPTSFGIAYLELFVVWWLISSFPEQFANRYIPIRVDNTNALFWLIKQSAPIPYLCILRPLFALLMKHNIRLYPIWIKSASNEFADWASRGYLVKLEKALPTWRDTVDTSLHCELPAYMVPGPLFLWRHGYYGRDVPDAWSTPPASFDDEPFDFTEFDCSPLLKPYLAD